MNYGLIEEKKKIAKRRKYKMLNADNEIWKKASEFFLR